MMAQMRKIIGHTFLALILGALAGCAIGSLSAHAKDSGQWGDQPSELRAWFNRLASGKGLCCSFADGETVQDVDWDTGGSNKDTQSEGGHYRVRLNGRWLSVPDDAVVTEPNKFGPAVVWPYVDGNGETKVRCFLPGAGS
jgi:hypothetical protein